MKALDNKSILNTQIASFNKYKENPEAFTQADFDRLYKIYFYDKFDRMGQKPSLYQLHYFEKLAF